MRGPEKVGFNVEWVKSVSREEFLETQSHLKDKVNLGEVYDSIVPKKANGNDKANAGSRSKGESNGRDSKDHTRDISDPGQSEPETTL